MFNIEDQSRNKLLLKGALISISESVADYPASTHKLTYTFKKDTNSPASFDTAANGTEHLLELTAVQSLTISTGYNTCSIVAVSLTDATEIIPIANLVVEFLPDLNTENDARSFYVKVLEKLETAILLLADKTMSSISIDGRSYTYNDLGQLERMRDYYSNKAGIKSDQSGRKRILANFTNE